MTKPRMPSGLSSRAKRFWAALIDTYEFEPWETIAVEDVVREMTVVDRLQRIVDSSESTRVRGSQGQPVAIPELAELRQHRQVLSSLMKALKLPESEEATETKRASVSEQNRKAARARWDRRGSLKVV